MFYVYIHSRADDGQVFYIGKGRGRRAWEPAPRSKWWTSVKNKHGLSVSIFRDELTEEEAFELESRLIVLFLKEGCPLVNMTNGGGGTSGHVKSSQERANISKRVRLNYADPEFRERRKESVKRAMKSPEIRQRVSDGVSNALKDPARRERNTKRLIALHATPEMRAMMRDKIRRRMCKPFRCIETGMIFEAQGDAALWLQKQGQAKAHQSGIYQALSLKNKSAYGYHWEHLEKN